MHRIYVLESSVDIYNDVIKSHPHTHSSHFKCEEIFSLTSIFLFNLIYLRLKYKESGGGGNVYCLLLLCRDE